MPEERMGKEGGDVTWLEEGLLECASDGGLARGGKPGEPDGEALLAHEGDPLLTAHVTLVPGDVGGRHFQVFSQKLGRKEGSWLEVNFSRFDRLSKR